MEEKKRKLIIDGNAFYEIDLECQKRKEQLKKQKNSMFMKKHNYEKKQRD